MEIIKPTLPLFKTALIRVSLTAAFKANPPQPHTPKMPISARLTLSNEPKKSTAAEKSSVLISGEAELRGKPELSPVNEPSNAKVTKPQNHAPPMFAHTTPKPVFDCAKRTAHRNGRQFALGIFRHI